MAKKRGRKRKTELYFGPEQEEAVVKYLNEEDSIERNKIYNEYLREPLNTMIDSIIRRYKLYRKDYSFENLHSETLSYLILKADKFESDKGKKAYSYYGTICKHYVLGLLIKDEKYTNQTLDFTSSLPQIHQKDEFIYHLSDSNYSLSDLIDSVCDEIRNEIEMDELEENPKKKMNDNEKKVGHALVDILSRWEILFEFLEGGSKFNKNLILATIRENTNLNTKEIRMAMRRFKNIYNFIKEDKIKKGYL